MNRRRVPWFFVVVLAIGSINWGGSENVEVPLGDGAWARLMPLAGVALGALWQLLDRRDLTQRLTAPAVFVAIAALVQVATGDVSLVVLQAGAGFGLVAGLVLAEQGLRRRQPREVLVAQASTGTTAAG